MILFDFIVAAVHTTNLKMVINSDSWPYLRCQEPYVLDYKCHNELDEVLGRKYLLESLRHLRKCEMIHHITRRILTELTFMYFILYLSERRYLQFNHFKTIGNPRTSRRDRNKTHETKAHKTFPAPHMTPTVSPTKKCYLQDRRFPERNYM